MGTIERWNFLRAKRVSADNFLVMGVRKAVKLSCTPRFSHGKVRSIDRLPLDTLMKAIREARLAPRSPEPYLLDRSELRPCKVTTVAPLDSHLLYGLTKVYAALSVREMFARPSSTALYRDPQGDGCGREVVDERQ